MSVTAEQIDQRIAEGQRRQDEYVALVRRLEDEAVRNPSRYRRRVWAVALAGYGYILALLAGCAIGLTWIVRTLLSGKPLSSNEEKLLLVLGFLIVMILRALWVRVEPPEGTPITRAEAPELYAAVDVIADELKAARPDEIRITEEVNAAAVQVARFGIFGGYRNVLVLGLPLLAGLTLGESRAVVAHEFGHFSGQHGRFGVWIYRLQSTWHQLAHDKDGQPRQGALFGPFLRWFYPQLLATTFALRRANEYEADRAAARVAGAPTQAAALMRLTYLKDHLDQTFWLAGPPQADRETLARLVTAAQSPADPVMAHHHLEMAFADVTGHDDTHPALGDRLKALGLPATTEVISHDMTSAIEAWLGEPSSPARAKLEPDLRGRLERASAINSHVRTASEAVLQRLEESAAERPCTEAEAFELAELTLELRGSEAGERRLRSLLASYPDNVEGALVLGGILLARNDEAGIEWLQRAAKSPRHEPLARQQIAAFYARRGEHHRVAELEREAYETAVRRDVADRWSDLMLTDEVVPPELSENERSRMREDLGQVDLLELAYLVQKTLPGTGESRTYLIVFFKRKLVEAADNSERLVASVAAKLTHPRPVKIEIDQFRGYWVRKLKAMPETLVFDRKAEALTSRSTRA